VVTGVWEAFAQVSPVPLPTQLAGPQIVWKPPASNLTVEFAVKYSGSSLSKLAEPSGGHITFTSVMASTPQNTGLVIKSSDGQVWQMSGSKIQTGTDEYGQPYGEVTFDSTTIEGKSLIDQIIMRRQLRVYVK